MPFAETPSGRLHYQICDVVAPWVKQPQTIIFHHGIAANLHLWTSWIPLLASRFRLVRFDMRIPGKFIVRVSSRPGTSVADLAPPPPAPPAAVSVDPATTI